MMTIYLTGFRCSDTQYLPNILSRQIIIIKPWSLHWDYDTRVVKDGIWAIPSAMTRLNGLQSMEMQLIRCISSCIPSNFQGKTLGQEGLHNSFAKSEMTNCYHLIIWYGKWYDPCEMCPIKERVNPLSFLKCYSNLPPLHSSRAMHASLNSEANDTGTPVCLSDVVVHWDSLSHQRRRPCQENWSPSVPGR